MVIRNMPVQEVARCYRKVRNVVVSNLSYATSFNYDTNSGMDDIRADVCRQIVDFLVFLAPERVTEYPLRVDIPDTMARYFARIVKEGVGQLRDQSTKSVTYKISHWDYNLDEPKDLAEVMCLQPVVCFDDEDAYYPYGEFELESLLIRLDHCFSQQYHPTSSRQLFLSDVPRIALTSRELGITKDADADALLKLYNRMQRASRPTWKEFTSTIKLVEPGFWPSRDDLEAGRRSV